MITEFGRFDELGPTGGEQAARAIDLPAVTIGVGDVGDANVVPDTADTVPVEHDAASYADISGTQVIGSEAAGTTDGGDDDGETDNGAAEGADNATSGDDLLRAWAAEQTAKEPTAGGGGGDDEPPDGRDVGSGEAGDDDGSREPGDNLPRSDESRADYMLRMIDRYGAAAVMGAMNPPRTTDDAEAAGDYDTSERPIVDDDGAPLEPDESDMRDLMGMGAVDTAMNEDPTIRTNEIIDHLLDDIRAAQAAARAEGGNKNQAERDDASADEAETHVDPSLADAVSAAFEAISAERELMDPNEQAAFDAFVEGRLDEVQRAFEHPEPDESPFHPVEPDPTPFEGVFESPLGAGVYEAHTEQHGIDADDGADEMRAILDRVQPADDYGAGIVVAYEDLVHDFVDKAYQAGADFAEIPLADPALYNAANNVLGEDNVQLVGGDGLPIGESEYPDQPKLVVDINQPGIVAIFDEEGGIPSEEAVDGWMPLNEPDETLPDHRFVRLPAGTIEVWNIPRLQGDEYVWDIARLNSVAPNPDYTSEQGPYVDMVQGFGQRAYNVGADSAMVYVDNPTMLEAVAHVFGRDNLQDENGEPLDYDQARQVVASEEVGLFPDAPLGVDIRISFRNPDVASRFSTDPSADE
jgi:cell pole-organizing protein PopZ